MTPQETDQLRRVLAEFANRPTEIYTLPKNYFIDATITVRYIHYGEHHTTEFLVNDVYQLSETDLANLSEVLIGWCVKVEHRGTKYSRGELSCKITYRSINKL